VPPPHCVLKQQYLESVGHQRATCGFLGSCCGWSAPNHNTTSSRKIWWISIPYPSPWQVMFQLWK
jgi:hypothetical protein